MSTILCALGLWGLALGCKGEEEDDTGTVEELDVFTVSYVVGWAEVGFMPVEGATVAFDDALGQRTEVVTGADGVASLELDWDTQGPISAVADLGVQGLPVLALVDLGPEDSGMVFEVADDISLQGTVTLSGTVTPRTEGAWLFVAAHGMPASFYQANTADYTMEVLPGLPFELLAMEFTWSYEGVEQGISQQFSSWTLVPSDGLSRDTTLDIDLGSPLQPSTTSGGFLLPEDPEDPLRAGGYYGYMAVYSSSDGASLQQCGWPTWIDVTGDGLGYSYTAEYLLPTMSGAARTVLVANGQSGAQAVAGFADLAGTAEVWDEVPRLLSTPVVDDQEVLDDGRWQIAMAAPPADGAHYSLHLTDSSGAVIFLIGNAAGEIVTAPLPPSTVDADALIEAGSSVLPYHYEDRANGDALYSLGASRMAVWGL